MLKEFPFAYHEQVHVKITMHFSRHLFYNLVNGTTNSPKDIKILDVVTYGDKKRERFLHLCALTFDMSSCLLFDQNFCYRKNVGRSREVII